MATKGLLILILFAGILSEKNSAFSQSSISSPFDLKPGRVIQIAGREVTIVWPSTRKIQIGQQLYALTDDLVTVLGVIEVTQPPTPGDAPIAQGRIISELKPVNFIDKPLLAARDVDANQNYFKISGSVRERTLDRLPKIEILASMASKISSYQRLIGLEKPVAYNHLELTLRGNNSSALSAFGLVARGGYSRSPLSLQTELREHHFTLGGQYALETSLSFISKIKLTLFPYSQTFITAGDSYHSIQRKAEISWEAKYELLKVQMTYSPPLAEKIVSRNSENIIFHDSLGVEIGSELPILRSGDKKSTLLFAGIESMKSSFQGQYYHQNISKFGLSILFR